MREVSSEIKNILSNLSGDIVQVNDLLNLKITDKIDDISLIWDQENKKGILNSVRYLKALENSYPEGLKSYYCLLYKKESPIGLFLFQVKDFDLRKSLNVHTHSESFLDKLWVNIKNGFISQIKHHLLVVGNVLLTGQYGINFCDHLSIEQKLEYLNLSVESFANYMNKNKAYKIKSILLKDFEEGEDSNVHLPEYVNFVIDPYMYIDIRWKTMDEYLDNLKSKYRIRYKRALKKGKDLSFEDMSLDQLVEYKNEMYQLYKQISQNVSFNLFDLDMDYFIKLKEQLGKDLTIKSVMLDGKLVAFYSLIFDVDHNELDAHFLGYNMVLNHNYQIYQNILYSILQDSISLKVKKINLSRTAMEIKSSVGAVDKTLFLLVKSRIGLMNWMLKKFITSYVPDNTWLPRQPFKEAEN